MGGMASRPYVSIASCRQWAGPSSRALGPPVPSLRPSLSGQQHRRRPTWLWMWVASMVSCPSGPTASPTSGLCPGPRGAGAGAAGGGRVAAGRGPGKRSWCACGVDLECGRGTRAEKNRPRTLGKSERPEEVGRKQQSGTSCPLPRLSWCLLLFRRPVLLPSTLLEHGGGAGWRHPEAQVGCMPYPAQLTSAPGKKGGRGRRPDSPKPPGSPLGMLGVCSYPRVSPSGTSWFHPFFMSLHMLSSGAWWTAGGAGRWL